MHSACRKEGFYLALEASSLSPMREIFMIMAGPIKAKPLLTSPLKIVTTGNAQH